ncbi:hypothetical protein ACFQ4A_18850 [Lentibacillus salinarum]|uniref:Uncharacterized protein n=1 Tax=Lentibacillus salinarum TaxID=446820 RepID=A0ABW3ZZ04_9BACI
MLVHLVWLLRTLELTWLLHDLVLCSLELAALPLELVLLLRDFGGCCAT